MPETISVPPPPTAEAGPELTPLQELEIKLLEDIGHATNEPGIIFDQFNNPNTSQEQKTSLQPLVERLAKENKAEKEGTFNKDTGDWELKDAEGNVLESGNSRNTYPEVIYNLLSFKDNPIAQEVGTRLAEHSIITFMGKADDGTDKEQAGSYSKWVEAGMPKVLGCEIKPTVSDVKAESTPKPEPPKTPEVNQGREELLEQERRGYEINRRIANGDLQWEYSMYPSENNRLNEANKGFPKTAVEKAYPGMDFSNPRPTDTVLLQNRLNQNHRKIRVYEEIRKSGKLTPGQEAEMAFLNGEQERIKGYVDKSIQIDMSAIDKEFDSSEGLLNNPDKQKKFLQYNQLIKDQWDNFVEQNDKLKQGVAMSFVFNGKEINISKKDLKDWGGTAATIAGLSMLLLFLEGEKEKPGAGGQPHA